MTGQVGLSFKEIAETITSFLEITIHTILCIRQIYPPTTFTRKKAHGCPVYQSRHPQVREYISQVISHLNKEIIQGNLRRLTIVIKRVEDGLPVERFLVDLGYLGMEKLGDVKAREAGLIGAPTHDDLSLMLRGFLIRLMALDGQLEDNRGELTFAIILETKDDLEPDSNKIQGSSSAPPWIPALASDTLHPQLAMEELEGETGEDCVARHEPLLHVKAIETGVIDVRLMVQECVAKTGVNQLRPLG